MRKIFVFALLFLLVSSFAVSTAHATELTTTEPVITTAIEETTFAVVDEGVVGYFEEITFDKVMAILQWGVIVIGFYTVLRQKVDVAVAKRRQKEAELKVTEQENTQITLLESFDVFTQTLGMIIGASKMPTVDKIYVGELLSATRTKIANTLIVVKSVTDTIKEDGPGIFNAAMDVVNVVAEGVNAVKTGNVQSVLEKYSEPKIGV
jgi:hypothetical protein